MTGHEMPEEATTKSAKTMMTKAEKNRPRLQAA
jgi:hypothetical protein